MKGAEVRLAPSTSALDVSPGPAIGWLDICRVRRSLAVVTWLALTIGGYLGYAVLFSRLFQS